MEPFQPPVSVPDFFHGFFSPLLLKEGSKIVSKMQVCNDQHLPPSWLILSTGFAQNLGGRQVLVELVCLELLFCTQRWDLFSHVRNVIYCELHL